MRLVSPTGTLALYITSGGCSFQGSHCGSFSCFLNYTGSIYVWDIGAALVYRRGVSNGGSDCGSYFCFLNIAIGVSAWSVGAALVLGGAQYYGSECGLTCCTLHDAIDTYYWHIGAVLVDKWRCFERRIILWFD